jgi:hypothetical protein
MMRLSLLLSLALLAGCDSPVPFTCGDFVPYAGAPTVEVGIATEAGIPWTEGGDVSLDLGGQGGFMVQPVLSLDPSAFGETAPERACARVEIDNIDPTGGDRFTGFETLTLDLPLRRNVVTGRLETAVIFNQLRWSPLPPNTAFGMSVVVRTETFAASVMREVLLQPGG